MIGWGSSNGGFGSKAAIHNAGTSRVAFGKPLAEQGVVMDQIARSRMEIEQARLLTLEAADMMDKVGNKAARAEIAMIKVIAPNMALDVIDRAIQVHGGGGVAEDFGLADAWAHSRTLRFVDGRTRSTGRRWRKASSGSRRRPGCTPAAACRRLVAHSAIRRRS